MERREATIFILRFHNYIFYTNNVRMQNLTLEKKVTEQAVLDRRQRCVKCPFNRTMNSPRDTKIGCLAVMCSISGNRFLSIQFTSPEVSQYFVLPYSVLSVCY